MKKRHLFLSFILLSAMGLTVSSCSSDDGATDPQGGATTITLAKKADVAICSGDQTLYSTLANKAVANAMLDGAEVKSAVASNGEVEVNLSVNAAMNHWDYIATKLSIHVRDTTDVAVTIPVPLEYYCQDTNAAAIIAARGNGKIEGAFKVDDSTTVDYTVGDQNIKLVVKYDHDSIYVKTSGINKEALKYLRTAYGDGLTFEVWNYYNNTTGLTRSKLKTNYLDKSTVTFIEGPAKYINAFAAINDYTGNVYGKKDEATGVWTPYEDAAFNTPLPEEYWYRPEDTRYYILKTHQYEWDCKVVPQYAPAYNEATTDVWNQVYTKK